MAKQTNIVIIGGTACGPKTAARARRCDPNAKITLIEQHEELSTATCGLPYYVSDVIQNRTTLLTRSKLYFENVFNLNVLTGARALSIDRKVYEVEIITVKTERRATIPYDKLVLATGSLPAIPNLPGKDLKGIVTLNNLEDADIIHSLVVSGKTKKVVIVGAGLIGIEMAEAFAMRGLEVTMIEALNWVLPALLDVEVAAHVEKHLRQKGINVLVGRRATGFDGDSKGWVRIVKTADEELEANFVLLALGVKPNVCLAKNAGLTIGSLGGIAVNESLRTSDSDIYAGGDCVENISLITQQPMLAPLGSTANKHGRLIGTNVTGGSETFPGIVGTAIAKTFDFNVGRTGLTETAAIAEGYEVITSLVSAFDHATYFPNSRDILVKLIVDKNDSTILGGQVVGTGDVAKRVDIIATALTCGFGVDDLADLDLAYAPPYNSALDPLHHAANVIRNQQTGLARVISPMEVKEKLDNKKDFILLDVRSPEEWKTLRINSPQTRLIPLPELRAKLDELPRDAEIITYCGSSIRAYQAQRILDGAGFKNVKFLAGSIRGWPYEL